MPLKRIAGRMRKKESLKMPCLKSEKTRQIVSGNSKKIRSLTSTLILTFTLTNLNPSPKPKPKPILRMLSLDDMKTRHFVSKMKKRLKS